MNILFRKTGLGLRSNVKSVLKYTLYEDAGFIQLDPVEDIFSSNKSSGYIKKWVIS
jgi:hypothetical protein